MAVKRRGQKPYLYVHMSKSSQNHCFKNDYEQAKLTEIFFIISRLFPFYHTAQPSTATGSSQQHGTWLLLLVLDTIRYCVFKCGVTAFVKHEECRCSKDTFTHTRTHTHADRHMACCKRSYYYLLTSLQMHSSYQINPK